ncbi:MAG: hypothetical protein R3B96_21830 [Pirellulaceae bacterium]
MRYCLRHEHDSWPATRFGRGDRKLAAKAGYDGIEPWIREIEVYQQEGGSLADLRKRLDDHGLRVESAIGFPQWIVDDSRLAREAWNKPNARWVLSRPWAVRGSPRLPLERPTATTWIC